MNLLFCIDRKFIPLLLSCLHSIALRGGAEAYHAYVLHSDLTEEDKEYLQDSVDQKLTFHFIPVPLELFAGFPETKRYPVQIYYRLAAPLLLPECLDRVLYLDVDTVIINSLSELDATDFEGNYFAACTHTREFLQKVNQFRLQTGEGVPYINTGVMLMNLPLLRRNLDLDAIRQYALEHQFSLILPDQDILTALYGDKVKILDSLRYNLSDRTLSAYNADFKNEKIDLAWVRQNSVIIHYFGKNKPWGPYYIGMLDTFYFQYGLPLEPALQEGRNQV